MHPRTQKQLDAAGYRFAENVRLMKAMGLYDYVHLMMHARAALSDSGTITEEASILNFRAVNLRAAHERPEGMEEGAVMMTGLNAQRVFEALRILESQPDGTQRLMQKVRDYHAPWVSEKVVRILMSYAEYVQRVVWHRN
jgi:UDP-N-acetylglucosamine 2-epimerase (non-hydrolysing)